MDNLFAHVAPASSGFRLDRLELYNWGTFDSSHGKLHIVRPQGATTLLIGQNGSGKSTLVDAILTLLVRPVVRNYNVAAGAHKQERDERTYIKGAYGRFSREDDNKAEIQYLRGEGKHYSSILACFRNDQGMVFTAALVLYLSGDGAPEKVYCIANREMSIAEHCAKLQGTERVRQQLEKRGFRATTSYTEYFSWFQRITGVRDMAMDMFNQTVAVKQIDNLNTFIRKHMLEAKAWRDKIENLQTHFNALRDAHQNLVRVRKKFLLLEPVVEKGKAYDLKSGDFNQAERIQAAADSYFRQATLDLFTPACNERERELERLIKSEKDLAKTIARQDEEIRQLKNDIDNAGGDRLKNLPFLIEREDEALNSKKNTWQRFCNDLICLGLSADVHDTGSFSVAVSQLAEAEKQFREKVDALDKERVDLGVKRRDLEKQKHNDTLELESLNQRIGNLPAGLSMIRQRMCEDLRLPDKEVPFAAELIEVKIDQRDWQASAEMVLRSFALSLLVPSRHYNVVSSYINRTRLSDAHGQGQRLHYVKVGVPSSASRHRPAIQPQSLLRKLNLREGHPLFPWVKSELEERFDLHCCETVEEFQTVMDKALTRERHIKWRNDRHEKDDRERTTDPRNYVLGWENKEKRRLLSESLTRLVSEVKQLDEQARKIQELSKQFGEKQIALERVKEIHDFNAIDFATHARQKDALEREKKSLEDNNQTIRTLRERMQEKEKERSELTVSRDRTLKGEERIGNELKSGRQFLANAEARLNTRRADGSLARHQEVFESIRTILADQNVSETTLFEIEQQFNAEQNAIVSRLRNELAPLTNELLTAMNTYLRQFPDDQADLTADVKYLKSFEGLYEQIRRDDLPRHEDRFKASMNEKVIHEIGILNGNFQSERIEIASRIDQLNQALRQLEYRPGTYMKLEPRDVHDREILEFRGALLECLAGTFEGTLEADEARYDRIEKFLARLRDDARWSEKVTDVRRWYDFVARELDAQTQRECAYYEDSAGQSGGEKAKLAFTILVAAIAYQYDLDPQRPAPDRFRFVVVDEMFSKVDDQYSEYALELFKRFGLQLLIVAPLDSKARVTEPHVECYLHVVKDAATNYSEIFSMTARVFDETMVHAPADGPIRTEVPA